MPDESGSNEGNAARLILASSSPRRAALLRQFGYEFEVAAPPLPEPDHISGALSPGQLAEALSYYKARSVAEGLEAEIVLAGDTVVALGKRIFGKPTDRADARRILEALTGTTHQVITGVTLLDTATGDRVIQHDSSAVTMRVMSVAEFDAYLDSGAWEGKAGAYGLQDRGDEFVTRLEGSFTNVVGFPMELVGAMLTRQGFGPSKTTTPLPARSPGSSLGT